MNKKYWFNCMLYSVISAIAYVIVALIVLKQRNFQGTWGFYIGSVAFVGVLLFYAWSIRLVMPTLLLQILAGAIASVLGAVIACLLLFLVLSFTPVYTLQDAPPSNAGDPTKGFLSMLFLNTVFTNIFWGAFATTMLSFALNRKNRKKSFQ